jgi:hypothetical protein
MGSALYKPHYYYCSKFVKTTIIQCYAHTKQATEEEKDMFYHSLHNQIDKTPRRGVLIIIGDFNAEIGWDNRGYETCMGIEGLGVRNDNGKLFIDICMENGQIIGRSIFLHKTMHKNHMNFLR